MKRLFLILAVLALFSVASFAAPTCGATNQDVLVTDFSCELGGLLFSNFGASSVNPPTGTPIFSIMNLGTGVVGSEVNLSFGTSMSAAGTSITDWWFWFQVDGGINGIDLGVGGTNASVSEKACSAPYEAGMICPDGSLLGSLLVLSNASGEMTFNPATYVSPVYIFKNIRVGSEAGGGGELSNFSQSFAIPEPVTMALFGSGLLALGLVRRFRR